MLRLPELLSNSDSPIWICWWLWSLQQRYSNTKCICNNDTWMNMMLNLLNCLTQFYFIILGRYQSSNGWGGSFGFGRPMRYGSPLGLIFPNRYKIGYNGFKRFWCHWMASHDKNYIEKVTTEETILYWWQILLNISRIC